jgi:hypothetical protein
MFHEKLLAKIFSRKLMKRNMRKIFNKILEKKFRKNMTNLW